MKLPWVGFHSTVNSYVRREALSIIRARAPLRLGLAGGGTDVSPFCDIHGGYVLNATIDRYAYATIKTTDHSVIRLSAADQQVEVVVPADGLLPLDGVLDLHKAVYNYMIQRFNGGRPIQFELTTFCDAPVGSGLGASSTLVVAMIKAFSELLNVPMDDYEMASAAFQIERIECGFEGGRQDQYSAAFGGFNFMEFYDNFRAVINPLRIKNWVICELEASLVLFFTGVSRESAHIIVDQRNNIKTSSKSALDAMHGMKQEAVSMKECLLKGDFGGIVESLRFGWENKKRSATSVSNSLIDSIYDAAIDGGALAGKVSGAGGGGFMLFFVPADRRRNVIRSLESFGGQVSNCHFTAFGAQSWNIA